MIRIANIVGARPQFIKSLPVSNEIRKIGREILIHTGQHYDYNMSKLFFEEMGIPKPDYNLNIGSGSHGRQTARMIIGLEQVLIEENPDIVLVYGDTNTTLAATIAASKLGMKVAHIEAGLRSFDKTMPEEKNRIVVDHLSDTLFCPTRTAVRNLGREGIDGEIELVGDVMYDTVLGFKEIAEQKSEILEELGIDSKDYLLATIHRSSNTDNPDNLTALLETLKESDRTVIFPVHPRTKKAMIDNGLDKIMRESKVKLVDPLGYIDFIKLETHAAKIITDSGGVQKEAYFLEVPCVTLRDATEWPETIEGGWNTLVGTVKEALLNQLAKPKPRKKPQKLFGDGKASFYIAQFLKETTSFKSIKPAVRRKA